MSNIRITLSVLTLTAVLASCGRQAAPEVSSAVSAQALQGNGSSATYLVSSTRALPASFRNDATRNGDQVLFVNEAAGLASVRTRTPEAYRRYADIVVRDVSVRWIPTEQSPNFKTVTLANPDSINPPTSTNPNRLFNLLWGLDAVNAPEAWAKGVRGAGVRVAVLDSGIDADHPDLVGNLNTQLSRSFVPTEGYDVSPGVSFSHGTHVAGTIAASDNTIGVVGVAPAAELVAVKVLSEKSGSGSFGGIISGIVYAASIQADVINMSLGAVLQKRGIVDDNGTPNDPSDDIKYGANVVADLTTALSRATTYAHRQGSTIIASEGNESIDKDKTADVISVPADSAHVLSISATAPDGWAKNPSTNLDVLSSYSNYGASAVNFSAPGGDFDLPGEELCTVASVTIPCWAFDMVLSTNNGGGYTWSAGTSMAAPHASGIAALIIGQNGGQMNPAAVASELAKRASDLGKPGNDPAHGAGRVSSGY